jgi:hypothetical protein
MTEYIPQRPATLEQRLSALNAAVAPDRDLWPGILARLDSRAVEPERQWSARRAGGWLPIGAALAAGYLVATLFPLPWAPVPGGTGAGPAMVSVQLLSRVQPALSQLPPKTRAVVEVDLSGLEHDRLSIDQALAMDPDNPLLRDLRSSAEARAASVLEQMNRLTRPVSGEDLEI